MSDTSGTEHHQEDTYTPLFNTSFIIICYTSYFPIKKLPRHEEIIYVDELENCSICYENNCKIKTICNHTFCEYCLLKWINENNNCPYCRELLSHVKFYRIMKKKIVPYFMTKFVK